MERVAVTHVIMLGEGMSPYLILTKTKALAQVSAFYIKIKEVNILNRVVVIKTIKL